MILPLGTAESSTCLWWVLPGVMAKPQPKEMLATILSQTGPGLKTSGNLNNLIGLPLMLLRLTKRDRWAVLEMGMSEPGEIDRLAEMAAPGVGLPHQRIYGPSREYG